MSRIGGRGVGETGALLYTPMLAMPREQSMKISSQRLGAVLGVLLLCLLAGLGWAAYEAHQISARTRENMMQFGLMFKMYANESAWNQFPPSDANPNRWTPNLYELLPKSPVSPTGMVSRYHPHHRELQVCIERLLNRRNPDYQTAAGLMAESFAYLDVAVQNIGDFRALVRARTLGLSEGSKKTIEVPGHESPLNRTREEFYSCFMSSRYGDEPLFPFNQSLVPTMVEVARWRYKDSQDKFPGAQVLYMDGHVEYVPLGTFPVVPEVMDVLSGHVPTQ